ncbi:MAG: glycosyltransferase [Nanoarchaeota archaeon]|nr:glycosyltransferase [Nanoarchaeota archaeon]
MKKIRIGVIPAAGRGLRAYSKTKNIPKPLTIIENKPIIQRNIEIMRDQFGIKKIYIIIGYLGNQIKKQLGNGSKFGVQINYVTQKKLSGIGSAIYLLKNVIKEKFLVILGDEIYTNSNHHEMQKNLPKNYDAICCFLETSNKKKIRKNYSGEFLNGKIKCLIEKPKKPKNNFIGCGTYIFTPKIFEYISLTPPSKLRNEVEITDVINNIAIKEKSVYPFFLKGNYANITTVEDMNSISFDLKSKNFYNYKVSLIIPAYNEEETIGNVIDEFKIPSIHEILVVDNNSTDKTAKIAKSKTVRVITEHKQGYGNALKTGMNHATGDILIITEADGTFRSKDIGKILEYLKDSDMVIGTRTTRQMIEQGANMGWFLRWGNVFLGKFIEVLWWNLEPRFTDVGCTYRGIWKPSYLKIKHNLNGTGPEFSPEMMIEVLKKKMRIIEIPVSYYKRMRGESKHSIGFNKIKTGTKMLKLIIKKRIF